MQDWNERAFLFVNGELGRPLLDPLFVSLSWLGQWAVAVPVVVLLLRAGRRDFLRRQLPVLVLGTLLVTVATQSSKELFDVDRPLKHFAPAIEAGEVSVRTPAPGRMPRSDSFPSGHAALSFWFMTYLSLARRRHAVWALPLAALIALSRVYVGAHFPLDCVAGAGLGAAIAVLGWIALQRIAPRPAPG